MNDSRRQLPSVDRLLREPAVAAMLDTAPRNAVVAAVRSALDAVRGNRAGPPADWGEEVREHLLRATTRSLRPVINATGVVLHTNLGRAPLAAVRHGGHARHRPRLQHLEFDLATGSRGHRADHCRAVARRAERS